MTNATLDKKLSPYADKERAKIGLRYFNSKLHCLGIPVTKLRALENELFSEEAPLPLLNKLFFGTEIFEARSLILIHLAKRKSEMDATSWQVLKGWSKVVDNWEHGDRLADIYAHLLEAYPSLVFPTLKKWNTSSLPWQRRLSIVSLFYYSAKRRKALPFGKALPLVDRLMYDKHVYVQKGVGWTLRELYNLYPDQTFSYLKQHARELSAIAWQAATEKLRRKDKELLKKLRAKK